MSSCARESCEPLCPSTVSTKPRIIRFRNIKLQFTPRMRSNSDFATGPR